MFQTLKYIPAKVWFIEGELLGVLAFSVGGLLWLLIPFLDITEDGSARSKVIRQGGVLGLAFILLMTALGYLL
ncbi:MAG: hypothetical protein ACE5GH_04800 [Fidelibacterota bacterium]